MSWYDCTVPFIFRTDSLPHTKKKKKRKRYECTHKHLKIALEKIESLMNQIQLNLSDMVCW
jgi:hypothetical protein